MQRLAAQLAVMIIAASASAEIINVPADYITIQEAIDAAGDGDEIVVAPGVYTSNQPGHVVDMKGKAITLRAAGAVADTVITGEGERRGLVCHSGELATTLIDGFTITNGVPDAFNYNGQDGIDWFEADCGGGVLCDGSSPTIRNCVISNNLASDESGGGIATRDSSPTIESCQILDNVAYVGAGVYVYSTFSVGGSIPVIVGCLIEGNDAAGYGGGLYGEFVAEGSEIVGNSASSGGGIYSFSGSPTLIGCLIEGNFAASDGGGLNVSSECSLVASACIFRNNAATGDGAGGGGIFFWRTDQYGGEPLLDNCSFIGNSAAGDGGGINCFYSSPSFQRCTFDGNDAAGGGGVHCVYYSRPTLLGCQVINNIATTYSGGGIRCDYEGEPRLTDCVVENNSAADRGGGIYMHNWDSMGAMITPVLVDCTVRGNNAVEGGGIDSTSNGLPSLYNTQICDNSPDQIRGEWWGDPCVEVHCDDCGFELPDPPQGQDAEPEYEYCAPAAGVNNLVVITHGIWTTETGFAAEDHWASQLKAAIESRLADYDDNSWEVRKRFTGWVPDPWESVFRLKGSGDGAEYSDAGYTHVHLIGHSAGAGYLDACAKRIRELRGSAITIHCTYLDPARRNQRDVGLRGDAADCAVNIFSRQGGAGECGFDAITSGSTQSLYDRCTNVDVSRLDPAYDENGWPPECLSSHGWPHCFYRISAGAGVGGSTDPSCDSIMGEYEPYGFNSSLEYFGSDADGTSAWAAAVSELPRGNDPAIELPAGPGFRGGSSGDEEYIVFEHFDDPLNLEDSMNYEYEGSVAIYWSEDSVALSASDYGGTSWINVELIPTKPTNIVKLRLAPGAVGAAVGLTTVLLDGEQIGIVDERHIPGEGDTYVFGMQRIAPPGEPLILSIRLDTFAAGDASMTASSIQIGHSDIRWHCLSDLTSVGGGQGNLDGMVDHADLDVILGEWGTFCAADCAQSACPGDIDFDCRVGVLDLLELLMSWGDCE